MQSSSAVDEVARQIKGEKQASDRLPYMVQLDALRALAVLGVLFGHLYLQGRPEILPIALWSVQLFFVLSGFLITGILLQCRELSSTRGGGFGQLRQFYARRTLRIFPVFYLVVLIAAALNIYPVRETFLWLVTYAANFHLALRGNWHASISHLWTLAVEEQFYVLWPWLILFVADRHLLPCIAGLIVLGTLWKAVGFFLGLNEVALRVMPFASMDSLGIGALLALYRHKKAAQFVRLGRHWAYAWISLVLAVVLVGFVFHPWDPALALVGSDLLAAILFATLIHKAAVGFGGLVGYLFETRPLLHCGKISYGIYLYHNFMLREVAAFCRHFGLPYPQASIGRFLLLSGFTIGIATLSWMFFEQPINNLKRRFRYSKP